MKMSLCNFHSLPPSSLPSCTAIVESFSINDVRKERRRLKKLREERKKGVAEGSPKLKHFQTLTSFAVAFNSVKIYSISKETCLNNNSFT